MAHTSIPTSNIRTAGDALCYHLELPKRFLQDGGLTFRPNDDNITFPLLAEMGCKP